MGTLGRGHLAEIDGGQAIRHLGPKASEITLRHVQSRGQSQVGQPIPGPTHPTDRFRRRGNQAEVLLGELLTLGRQLLTPGKVTLLPDHSDRSHRGGDEERDDHGTCNQRFIATSRPTAQPLAT